MQRLERPGPDYYTDHSVIDELISIKNSTPLRAGRLAFEAYLKLPEKEREAYFEKSKGLDLFASVKQTAQRKLELEIANDMLLLESLDPTPDELKMPSGASGDDEDLRH